MGSKYTSVSLSGYNSSPPADDGTQVDSNKVEWQKHVDKLGDPLKTQIAAIDTALVEALDITPNAKSTAYTTVAGDNLQMLECTGTFTVTLLGTATAGAGYTVTIKNISTGVITVDGAGSEMIDGFTTITLNPRDSITVQVDAGNSEYRIINSEWANIGEIVAWPLATVKPGTLECDGTAVSRTTYADLFAVIGTAYGIGDGSTTFNLPDYRGEFLRGYDNGAGNDPDAASRTDRGDGTTGDNVGTKQDEDFLAHTHDLTLSRYGGSNVGDTGVTAYSSGLAGPRSAYTGTTDNGGGGNETRPRNVSIMYCIKY